MAIRERVMDAWKALTAPKSYASGDEAALREMYDGTNATANHGLGAPIYQGVNTVGIRTELEVTCLKCRVARWLLMGEAFRDYACPACKTPLDIEGRTGIRLSKNKDERARTLRKFAGIVEESEWSLHGPDGDYLPASKHDLVLSTLPIKPSRGAQGQGGYAGRVIDTGAFDGFSGDFEFESSDPGTGSNWR